MGRKPKVASLPAEKQKRAGKPKPSKAKASKTKSVPAAGRSTTTDDNDAIRANFLQHRTFWNAAQAKLETARKLVKDVVAAAKADGFLRKEFEVADALNGSPKSEAKVTAEVSLRLRVARWLGHPMGRQLDLFDQPDRTPAVESAYDAGKTAAMEHKPASPPHDASTPQYERWLRGYHDEQARQLKAGIKPLDGNGSLDDVEEDDGPAAEIGARDPARPLSDFH